MLSYILRRILLMIPTLLGMVAITFAVVQVAPGGPVEKIIAQIQGHDSSATGRIGGAATSDFSNTQASQSSGYRGAQGIDPEFIKELERQFGFDKPPLERFLLMVKNYATFDFGKSYFRDTPVVDLIAQKLPVSISLGMWLTFLSYAISIPLGIRKALYEGTKFDMWSSVIIVVGYAVPGFLFAVLLQVVFAGGSFWNIFPARDLVSDNWASMPLHAQILDYLWHMVLPVTAMAIGAFATTTLLTKNSFLEEIGKTYVMTARMKGLSERKVLYGHVFRNAMLIVIAGFPGAFVHAFFTGSLLIEMIFSLDGLGLLSFESLVNRDYPVVFANLFIFGLIGLVVNLISDLTYMWVDPRIDFEAREGG